MPDERSNVSRQAVGGDPRSYAERELARTPTNAALIAGALAEAGVVALELVRPGP
jgi:hypothetical protein